MVLFPVIRPVNHPSLHPEASADHIIDAERDPFGPDRDERAGVDRPFLGPRMVGVFIDLESQGFRFECV